MFLRCGVVQFQHRAGAKNENFAMVERFARRAQRQGVKLLAFRDVPHWLLARASTQPCWLAGSVDDEARTGNAMIIGWYGRIQAESDALGDDLVVANLDLPRLPLCTGRRWIRARRPDLYGLLMVPLGHELSPQQARFSEEPT